MATFLEDWGNWLNDLAFGNPEQAVEQINTGAGASLTEGAQNLGKQIGFAKDLASLASITAHSIGRENIPGYRQATDVGGAALDAYNWVWDEAINQPLSTVFQAAKMARMEQVKNKDSALFGDVKYMFDSDLWERAYKAADTKSIGQSFIEAGLVSSFNPGMAEHYAGASEEEWKKVRETPMYNIASGGVDLGMNLRLDPGIVLGKGASAFRQKVTKRPIKPGEDIEAAMSTAPTKWYEKHGPLKERNLYQRTNKVIATVRNRPDANYIYNAVEGLRESSNGPALAAALAKAGRSSEEETKLVLRLAYGDSTAVSQLGKRNAEIADLLVKANDETNHLLNSAKYAGQNYFGEARVVNEYKTRLGNIKDVEKKLQDERARLDFYGQQAPDAAAMRTLSSSKRSEQKAYWSQFDGMVQPTIWNLPVRVVEGFSKQMPPNVIELDDPRSVHALQALLDKTPLITPATRNGLLSKYMEAANPSAKFAVVQKAKAAVITAKAKQWGLSKDDAETVVRDFMYESDRVARQHGFGSAERYSGAVNPATGKPADLAVSDDGEAIAPILTPQLANLVPLPNVDVIDRALKRNAGIYAAMNQWVMKSEKALELHAKGKTARAFDKKAYAVADFGADAANSLLRWWKAAVLIGRPISYATRVLIDDDLRIWAKLGTAANAMHGELLASGARAAWRGLSGENRRAAKAMWQADKLAAEDLKKEIEYAKGLNKSEGAVVDTEPLEHQLKEIEARLTEAQQKKLKKVYKPQEGKRLGEADEVYGGVTFHGAFGGPDADLHRSLASNGGLLDRAMVYFEEKSYSRKAAAANGYRRVEPGEPGHPEEWLNAINKQLKLDPMAQQFIMGKSEDEVLKWLKRTDEGRAHMREIGVLHSSNPERWVQNVKATVDSYIPDAQWRISLQKRQLRADELKKWIDDGNPLPAVHGANLEANLGRGHWAKTANETVSKLFRLFSELPEEKLARHPLYNALYQQRAHAFIDQMLADPKRLELGKRADALDADDMKRLYKESHAHALKGLKDTLWDISAYSNSAHMLRFVSPFIHAWQETLKRWWQLEKDKPQLLAYFMQAWQAPNKMGLVVDGEGNPVDESSGLTDDESIVLKFPAWMGGKAIDIPGFDYVPYLTKSSFNLVLQGDPWWLPGSGPLVQAPLSYWANEMPQYEDTMKKFGLLGPGGANKDTADAFLPAYAKRWRSYFDEGQTQRDFAQAHALRYKEMLVDWEKAGRPGKWNVDKKWQQALADTKGLFMMKAISAHFLPVTSQYRSKYQFYIDAYRRLRDEAARSPDDERTVQWVDEQFYAKYPEYFELVQSTSQTNVNVPPTISGVDAAKKYADLISQFPELSGQIIAQEGEGEFSRAAYQYETRHTYQAGNPETMRSHKDPRKAVADAEAKRGWLEYTKLNNLLNSVAQRNGLNSYRESEQLSILHKLASQRLAAMNPSWEKDYNTRDMAWFARQMPGIEALANDSRLKDRSDVKVLRQYLEFRSLISKKLEERRAAGGSNNMSAKSNLDLARLYSRGFSRLTESNTYFDEHWGQRVLQADPYLIDLLEVQEGG